MNKMHGAPVLLSEGCEQLIPWYKSRGALVTVREGFEADGGPEFARGVVRWPAYDKWHLGFDLLWKRWLRQGVKQIVLWSPLYKHFSLAPLPGVRLPWSWNVTRRDSWNAVLYRDTQLAARLNPKFPHPQFATFPKGGNWNPQAWVSVSKLKQLPEPFLTQQVILQPDEGQNRKLAALLCPWVQVFDRSTREEQIPCSLSLKQLVEILPEEGPDSSVFCSVAGWRIDWVPERYLAWFVYDRTYTVRGPKHLHPKRRYLEQTAVLAPEKVGNELWQNCKWWLECGPNAQYWNRDEALGLDEEYETREFFGRGYWTDNVVLSRGSTEWPSGLLLERLISKFVDSGTSRPLGKWGADCLQRHQVRVSRHGYDSDPMPEGWHLGLINTTGGAGGKPWVSDVWTNHGREDWSDYVGPRKPWLRCNKKNGRGALSRLLNVHDALMRLLDTLKRRYEIRLPVNQLTFAELQEELVFKEEVGLELEKLRTETLLCLNSGKLKPRDLRIVDGWTDENKKTHTGVKKLLQQCGKLWRTTKRRARKPIQDYTKLEVSETLGRELCQGVIRTTPELQWIAPEAACEITFRPLNPELMTARVARAIMQYADADAQGNTDWGFLQADREETEQQRSDRQWERKVRELFQGAHGTRRKEVAR